MKNEINEIQKTVLTNDYIKDIKAILAQAKNQSYKSVNSIMIQAYWLVGWRIIEQEQQGKKRAGYGEKIIENLSKSLNDELGSGMSEAHLKNCRQFFLTFSEKQICYTLCSELSWSHLRLIMRLDTEKERNYYPTIGIIFCADKDESVVKYSVLSESEQIFASKYKTVLPTEEELSAELDRNRRFLEEKSGAEK